MILKTARKRFLSASRKNEMENKKENYLVQEKT